VAAADRAWAAVVGVAAMARMAAADWARAVVTGATGMARVAVGWAGIAGAGVGVVAGGRGLVGWGAFGWRDRRQGAQDQAQQHMGAVRAEAARQTGCLACPGQGVDPGEPGGALDLRQLVRHHRRGLVIVGKQPHVGVPLSLLPAILGAIRVSVDHQIVHPLAQPRSGPPPSVSDQLRNHG
jgi:hypothetical protein